MLNVQLNISLSLNLNFSLTAFFCGIPQQLLGRPCGFSLQGDLNLTANRVI